MTDGAVQVALNCDMITQEEVIAFVCFGSNPEVLKRMN
jgi:hypothetical protein